MSKLLAFFFVFISLSSYAAVQMYDSPPSASGYIYKISLAPNSEEVYVYMKCANTSYLVRFNGVNYLEGANHSSNIGKFLSVISSSSLTGGKMNITNYEISAAQEIIDGQTICK